MASSLFIEQRFFNVLSRIDGFGHSTTVEDLAPIEPLDVDRGFNGR
jgi:hypothetical protein